MRCGRRTPAAARRLPWSDVSRPVACRSRVIGRGEAMRIFTGAPLPEGADTVVPQEDVEASGDRIALREASSSPPTSEQRGEDVRVGDRVLDPGRVLSAAEIGLLATLGYGQVRVYRRPRVAILSTGNELADLGGEPGPGQIPNTNTYTLMAQVLEAGGDPVSLGVVPDRLEAIEERVRAARDEDVLVSSAGVSVGRVRPRARGADAGRRGATSLEGLHATGQADHIWIARLSTGVRAARQPVLRDGDVRALRASGAAQDDRAAAAHAPTSEGARARARAESRLAARLSAGAARSR